LAEFIPPSESRSPTKTFAIGANGDGDQVGVTAAPTIGVVDTAVTDAVEAAGVAVLTSEETTTLAAAVRAWPRAACDCGSSATLIAAARAEVPLLVVFEVVPAAVAGA
jgi:hypothetical protein